MKSKENFTQNQESKTQSEFKYHNLISAMMNAFALHEMIFDKNGKAIDYRFLELNPAWEKVVGIKAETVIGKTVKEIMPDIEESWIEFYGRIVKTGIPEEFEDYNKATGKYFHVYAFSPETNKFAVFFNDITDKKNNEKHLFEQKNLLDSIINESPSPMWISDNKGLLIRCNDSLLNTLNVQESDVVGIYNVLNDKNILKQGNMPLVQNVFKKKQVTRFNLHWENKKGGFSKKGMIKDLYIDATLFPILDSNDMLQYVVCQWMDITNQHLAEEELRKSEKKYRLLVENQSDILVTLDRDYHITFTSPNYSQTFGIKEKDILNNSFMPLIHEDDQDIVKASIDSLKTPPHTSFHEERSKTPNGWRWFSWNLKATVNNESIPIQIIAVGRDITEQKEIELQNEVLSRFPQENPNPVLRISADGYVMYANPGSKDVLSTLGVDAKNRLNSEWREIIETVLTENTPMNSELTAADRIYNIISMPIIDHHYVNLYLNDITEQKKATKALIESENKYRSYIDNAPNGVFVVDLKGNYLSVNQAGAKLTGHPPKELVGKNIRELGANSKAQEDIGNQFAQLLKTGHLSTTLPHRKKDGTIDWWQLNAVKLNGDRIIGFTTDITDRIKAEKERETTESRFRELVNTINSGVAIYKVINNGQSGKDYIIQDFNRTALDLEKLKKEDVVGKNLFDIRPNIDEFGLIPIFQKVWKTGEPAFYPAKIYIDEKYSNYYENRVFRLPNHEIVAIYDDVTERERASEKIQESEKRFELAMKASQDGLYDWDLKTNEIYYSPGWKKMLGYEYDELPNDFSVWENHTKEEDAKRSWEMQNKVINKELARFELEFKMKHKNGHWVDILSRAEAIFDDSGKAIRMIGTHVDISERKKSEEKIQKLSTAIEQSPSVIIITDLDGKIEYVNPKFTELTGYSSEEALGQKPRILKSGELPEKTYENLWRTLKEGKEWSGEFHNKTKDGTLFWEAASISPILNENGEITNYLKVAEDITERKEADQKLKLALEKAKESDTLKSAFLANMSHEIRTPMNGIMGFSSLLKQDDLNTAKQHEYVDIIERSGKRMLNTINDLIDISRIEAGQVKIDKKTINLSKLLNDMYTFFMPEAKERGLDLIYENYLDEPNTLIYTDEDKFYSIMSNYLKNALKYTNQGHISFGYVLEKDNIELFVKDTGIGVSPDRHKAIFERFVQADLSITKPYEGAGLGLAISKAYAKMINATVRVESVEGQGSTFYLRLPFSDQNKPSLKSINGQKTMKKNVQLKDIDLLIVEDDPTSVLYLQLLLESHCKSLRVATTGNEALDLIRKHKDLDLILMDVKMPDMDGYDVTRLVRKFNTDVLIIAQTAYAMESDREKAMQAGCNAYISKPIREEELFPLISKLLNSEKVN